MNHGGPIPNYNQETKSRQLVERARLISPANRNFKNFLKKSSNSMSTSPVNLILTAINILCLSWVILVFLAPKNWNSEKYTIIQLEKAKLVIEKFNKTQNRTPASQLELKLFSKSNGWDLSFYDGYGYPYEYIQLDQEHFILRSFGQVGLQMVSRKHWQNFFVDTLPKLPINSPLFIEYQPIFYPSEILFGSYSSDKKYYAQVYQNNQHRKRYLVIRSIENKNFLMIAKHDFIEEFFWLPDSQKIVFTASLSEHYRDGVYLWDLANDQIENAFDKVNFADGQKIFIGVKANKKKQPSQYIYSLAGYDLTGKKIYIFSHAVDELSISAREFYQNENLYELDISQEGKFKLSPARIDFKPGQFIFTDLLKSLVSSRTMSQTRGSKLQQQWVKLRFEGIIGEILEEWQEYSQKLNETPNFAYTLWYITCLYSDAMRLSLAQKNKKEAEVLRSFGTEIAKALGFHAVAPKYLQALGHDAFMTLSKGQPLPFSFFGVKKNLSKRN